MGSSVKDIISAPLKPFESMFGLFGGQPKPPALPSLPPPVTESDVSEKTDLYRKKLRDRKGRQSTILASLGSTNQGKKTVLG